MNLYIRTAGERKPWSSRVNKRMEVCFQKRILDSAIGLWVRFGGSEVSQNSRVDAIVEPFCTAIRIRAYPVISNRLVRIQNERVALAR